MLNPSLIVFLGPMGAGKSTQIKLLKSELKRKGSKVKVSYVKSGIISSFLTILLVRILVGERKDKAPIMVLVTEKPFFRKIFSLWLFLDLLSCSCKCLLDVYLPIKLGYIVLAEDYLHSVIIDDIYYSKLMKLSIKQFQFIMKSISRLLNLCPLYTVYLDATIDKLKIRHSQRGDPYEDLNYLYEQRSTLKVFSKTHSKNGLYFYVNTNMNSVRLTHKKILNYLKLSHKTACATRA